MIVARTLSDRTHSSCPHCGLAMDRDENAGVQYYEIGAELPWMPHVRGSREQSQERLAPSPGRPFMGYL
ncbi:MAG: hypothetical protein GX191_04710 [Candidatus Methanoculleus thermohydrogenotrophicum]|jgi:hypothetical protein|nr:hypothetical protein [Candidatus Methanoculleus thermohydrogenotrophicum]